MIGGTASREFWREDSPLHYKHARYRGYDANISKCSSKCSISSHIWGTGSLEQRLLNCLWPCDLRVDVDVKDCHASRNFMEGALGSRLSMTFQTCKIPKLRVPYFRMLLNMSNEESYVKDESARAKLAILPLTLSCSAVHSRTSFWRRREFWREDSPWHFNHAKYRGFGANFSICCSLCSILDHIWRTASLEQRLFIYLWACDLRVVVHVGVSFIAATARKDLWQESSP